MRLLSAILKRIAKLRIAHTSNFENEQWQANDTISRKLKSEWFAYTLTAEGMRAGHRCFYCGKVSEGIQYLMAGNPTEPEYFCSEECSKNFGILKGKT